MKIYLAAPIFSESDRLYNEILATKIEKALLNVELYVPQRNKSINDKTKCATAEDITKGDFDNNLDYADIVVARVDGDVPPIGTTLEIGYFCRRCQEDIQKTGKTNKRIFALYTDSREPSHTVNDTKVNMLHEFAESQFSYINLLLVGALKRYGDMFYTMDDLVDNLKSYVEAISFVPFSLESYNNGLWHLTFSSPKTEEPVYINNVKKKNSQLDITCSKEPKITVNASIDSMQEDINILKEALKELRGCIK